MKGQLGLDRDGCTLDLVGSEETRDLLLEIIGEFLLLDSHYLLFFAVLLFQLFKQDLDLPMDVARKITDEFLPFYLP